MGPFCKIDRSGWPAGPWDTEPEDRIEWRAGAYRCWIERADRHGFWSGYVLVPDRHRAAALVCPGAADPSAALSGRVGWWAHRGLSLNLEYAGGAQLMRFDCARSGDRVPASVYGGHLVNPPVYRTARYAADRVRSMARAAGAPCGGVRGLLVDGVPHLGTKLGTPLFSANRTPVTGEAGVMVWGWLRDGDAAAAEAAVDRLQERPDELAFPGAVRDHDIKIGIRNLRVGAAETRAGYRGSASADEVAALVGKTSEEAALWAAARGLSLCIQGYLPHANFSVVGTVPVWFGADRRVALALASTDSDADDDAMRPDYEGG